MKVNQRLKSVLILLIWLKMLKHELNYMFSKMQLKLLWKVKIVNNIENELNKIYFLVEDELNIIYFFELTFHVLNHNQNSELFNLVS